MKISGYTYVKDAVSMDYPFVESIKSHLDFCDEVVVVDASIKNDGTKEALQALKKENKDKLKLFEAKLDWTAPNYGIYDGVLKQIAREKCTSEFLWQFDVDECVHAIDRNVLKELLKQCDNLQQIPVLCLPVVEYWGGLDKVRIDVNSWKWRLSRNHPEIVHGIPITHRQIKNGLVYATPGTDTCDLIVKSQGLPVPNLNFINEQTEKLRIASIRDEKVAQEYEKWFNQIVSTLPTVYHFSWFSIKSKIEKYRDFFGDFWKAMYGDERSTNVFFGVPWSEVTPEMIEAKAKELKEGTGGWVFHQPWDGSKLNSIKIYRQPPVVMQEWCNKHPI